MSAILKTIAMATALIGVGAPSATAAEKDLQPVELFAELPAFSNLQFSRDRKYYAFATTYKGAKHIMVRDAQTHAVKSLTGPIDDAQVVGYQWLNESRLVVHYLLTVEAMYADTRSRYSRMLVINADGSDARWMVENKKNMRSINKARDHYFDHGQIIDTLPAEHDYILHAYDNDLDGNAEIRKLNIYNGGFSVINTGAGGWSYYTNRKHELALGVRSVIGGKIQMRVRVGDHDWRDLDEIDLPAFAGYRFGEDYNFAGFSNKDNEIWIQGPTPAGTQGFYKLNLDTSTLEGPVFSDPEFDVAGLDFDQDTGELTSLAITRHFYEETYLDPFHKKVMAAVDKALPDTHNYIVQELHPLTEKGNQDYSKEANFLVILASSDRDPGVYYTFDLTTMKIDALAELQAGIDPEKQGHTSVHKIAMRDGKEIYAYVTLPVGKDPKNLPTVVLPHGGPWARDTQDWDWWTQFVASRGYAVLRPNYRGSDGMGQAFMRAGDREWGGLMQQDVTDSLKWMIKEGIADKDRVCIIGASYGGYAAAIASIVDPGLYKCAVTVNGAVNLMGMKNSDRWWWNSRTSMRSFDDMVGYKDQPLEATSPHHQAERMTAPILVVASKNDARLDWEYSKDFYDRLQKLGKPSEFLLIPDGDHFMLTKESRMLMLSAVDEFLNKYIGR